MSEDDPQTKTNQVGIPYNGETITTFFTGDEWLDAIDEFVEETRFPSRAAAMRSLIFLGMREYALGDPRRSQNQQKENQNNNFSPVTIRELIPEGKDNAVSLKSELTNTIDKQLLEIVEEDPEINRDGWKVYR